MSKPIIQSSYLHNVITPQELDKTVNKLSELLEPFSDDFDTIVFRGLSGTIVAPMLAVKMNKQMLAVRKPESSHSCYSLEGNIGMKRYIIVDDLVATGDTLKIIVSTIKEKFDDCRIPPSCVGVALYADRRSPKKGTIFRSKLNGMIHTLEFAVNSCPDQYDD